MGFNSFFSKWGLLGCFMGLANFAWAQNHQATVQSFLKQHAASQELTATDIADWVVTDEYQTKHNGITHVYIRQQHHGIPVSNGVANFNINAQGEVLSMGNRLVSNLAQRINATTPRLTPAQAIEAAAATFGLSISEPLRPLEAISAMEMYYNKAGISKKEIPVQLTYWQTREEEVRLAWNLSIYTTDAKHWWNVWVDAQDGRILHHNDWVVSCNFGTTGSCSNATHQHAPLNPAPQQAPSTMMAPDHYNVFALPVESPNHGTRSLLVNPANLTASPFGWHDTNGAAGAEYQITRGNNVYAYEDADGDDQPGYSPNGGGTLNFDFPLNLNQAPANYQDPAITNLFYMNNMMHDIWYQYGFDEAAGNFQQNNYGNGGQGADYVLAEGQDGGGTDNANFATPPDGDNGIMQMYLWTAGGSSSASLNITAPGTIAGSYGAVEAGFGPGLTAPVTGTLALVVDNTAPTNDACETVTNAAAINGKIGVALRGTCNFITKVQALENAGAIAVIIINNVAGAPIAMGGTGTTGIPSVMISQADGNAILAQLNAGATVTGTLQAAASGNFDRDGDLDNGVMAHEYGHGISTRLTGGPSNSDCLYGDEQMGEGWSDWFATILTMQPNHVATTPRPMGTYAAGEPITGIGIREAPYTTDMSVNPYTYDATNDQNLSVPHGVGFVWATMLWDLTWAFIDQYGYDPDMYNGTGGNNIVMQLVMDGMKLQPCDPGFVDGRDAILQADMINNGGANQCLIWEAFARRGLGYSADQGSTMSRTDQTEAFDIPPTCQTPTSAPTAAFASSLASSCGGLVQFTDNSTDIPQQWAWDFGDGSTSNQQNPSHTYATSGVYTVELVVTNTLGSDTYTQTVTIQYPAAPTANDATVCYGNSATLNASASGTVYWYDNGNLVAAGNTFTTPPITTTTAYEIQNAVTTPAQFVGPNDNSFGTGGYHGTTFTGTVDFTAFQGLDILSAWVDANGGGDRTLYLWDDVSGAGNVIDQVTVTIPDGQSRVALNFQVPGPGTYSIGGTGVNLYRNNAGTAYPYTIAGLISITGSSAGTDFYYYLYDLEVQPAACLSPIETVTVDVEQAAFNYTSTTATGIQFTDASTGATSWAWDFGDGNTSTQQNPMHTYASAGTYTVTLVINGTCTITAQITTGTSALVSDDPDFFVQLMPNPATEQTVLYLSQPLAEDMQVELLGIEGRVHQLWVVSAGNQQLNLPLNDLPAAVYFVRMRTSVGTSTHKLVVRR